MAGSSVAVSAMFEYTAVIGASDALLPPEEQLTMKMLAENSASSLKSFLRTFSYLSLFIALVELLL